MSSMIIIIRVVFMKITNIIHKFSETNFGINYRGGDKAATANINEKKKSNL